MYILKKFKRQSESCCYQEAASKTKFTHIEFENGVFPHAVFHHSRAAW